MIHRTSCRLFFRLKRASLLRLAQSSSLLSISSDSSFVFLFSLSRLRTDTVRSSPLASADWSFSTLSATGKRGSLGIVVSTLHAHQSANAPPLCSRFYALRKPRSMSVMFGSTFAASRRCHTLRIKKRGHFHPLAVKDFRSTSLKSSRASASDCSESR